MDYASLETFKILTLNKSYVFHSFLQSCYRKSSVKRLVQVSGNRSGRILSLQLRGPGICPLRNPLGGGHLIKERALTVGNLTKKNKKCQMPGGQPGGGGGVGWALLDLTHT